ncbi:MAG TPA: MFS transporter [Nitrolancea sp.]|nr:MFS transporter [Nitrolancea sp.]
MAQNTADPRDPVGAAPGTGPLLFIVFIMVASTSTLWPILTPYAKDLGASGFELGLVVSSIYFTRLILGPWVGRFGDKRGYRGLLIAGTLLYIPIGLAYAGANNVFTLAGARALHGVGSAIVLPMVMAVMGQHAGGKSGATMARYNAAQWLGYALGPLAGGLVVHQFGNNGVFLLLAPAGIVSAVAVLMLDRRLTDPPARPQDRPLGKIRIERPARVLLAFNFIVAPTSLIVLSFFPLLGDDRGYGSVLVGGLLSIASFATAAVQPFWGNVADRTGIQPLLLFGGAGTLVGLVILANFSPPLVAVAATLIAGVSIAALVAGVSTSAIDLGKTHGMGTFVGIFQSVGSLGQALMPLAYGVVLGQIHVSGLLSVVGGLIAVSSLAYLISLTPALKRGGARARSEL